MTRAPAFRTLIVDSARKLKNLFVHANYTRIYCIRTIHVPNRFNIAFVIPAIRAEVATHRKRSHLRHFHLQRNIIS